MEAGPRISVITALRDAERHLPALLEALASQTLAASDWEIVAAVAGSDRTTEILRDAAGRSDLPRIEIIDNPRGLAATGLNRALAVARGAFIARLDARSEPAPDYLERILDQLASGDVACVGGPQLSAGRGPWGRAYARVVTSPAGHGGAAYRRSGGEPREVDTVYLGAWPRASLLAVGAFDESLPRNQDDELAMRIRAAGGRILLDPAIRIVYRPREEFPALLRQYFDYGRWKPRVLARHPAALSPRHLIPALVFLWLLASGALLVSTSSPGALLLVGVWPVAVFALLAPALRGLGAAAMLRCFILAAAMTPAYGLGFILGTPLAFSARPEFPALGEVGA